MKKCYISIRGNTAYVVVNANKMLREAEAQDKMSGTDACLADIHNLTIYLSFELLMDHFDLTDIKVKFVVNRPRGEELFTKGMILAANYIENILSVAATPDNPEGEEILSIFKKRKSLLVAPLWDFLHKMGITVIN